MNPSPPTIMHIDLNSCFATIEQQANPLLRGKPVAVAAYTTGNGCILAPSVEAKRFGVKTGMRVRDGKALCPQLLVLPSDPWKYRFINRKLLVLLGEYSSEVEVKSIDEMVLSFAETPALTRFLLATKLRYSRDLSSRDNYHGEAMLSIGKEIKERIKNEIGEWLTVSIGIAPNRFLAKTAAGLHKPDGLDVIDRDNVEETLFAMKLEDLCGIKKGNGGRLRLFGIRTTRDFYQASQKDLERAFHSIVGYHWWMRLHGWEIDDREFSRKSFGHSYALYKPFTPVDGELHQILSQLVLKMGRRLRSGKYVTQGIHVSCCFTNHTYWHHGEKLPRPLFTSDDLYNAAKSVLAGAPTLPVRILAVSCFDLSPYLYDQQSIFTDETKKVNLTKALDALADRWGDFIVTPGRMLGMGQKALDRIAFGRIQPRE